MTWEHGRHVDADAERELAEWAFSQPEGPAATLPPAEEIEIPPYLRGSPFDLDSDSFWEAREEIERERLSREEDDLAESHREGNV